jgi:hypothetical protein
MQDGATRAPRPGRGPPSSGTGPDCGGIRHAVPRTSDVGTHRPTAIMPQAGKQASSHGATTRLAARRSAARPDGRAIPALPILPHPVLTLLARPDPAVVRGRMWQRGWLPGNGTRSAQVLAIAAGHGIRRSRGRSAPRRLGSTGTTPAATGP